MGNADRACRLLARDVQNLRSVPRLSQRTVHFILSLAAICLSVLLALAAPGAAQDANDDDKPPWFTGPLLVPGAEMFGAGGLYLQPYYSLGDGLGVYNHNLSTRRNAVDTALDMQLILGYGFTDSFEVQVDAEAVWNNEQDADDFGAADTQLELHYLVIAENPENWTPALRVDYVQLFPTGTYQRLDPAKRGTDALGSGTFAPSLVLNLTKTFHLGGEHFFRPDASLLFAFPLPTRVHGLNTYGGGSGTDGTVDAGNAFTGYLSGEYSLTRNWALAFDSTYTYIDITRFTGSPGVNPDGTPAEVGVPSGYQITFSPQIEYNLDSNQGLVMGPWFTVIGKDTEDFLTFVVSYAAEFDLPPLW